MLDTALTKQLANYLFDRHFLHVDVADIARLKNFPASFSDFRARDFELHRHRGLLNHFAEP